MRLTAIGVCALALLAAGCAGGGDDVEQSAQEPPPAVEPAPPPAAEPAPAPASANECPAAWKAGWQKLANEIGAPVYCPDWMPEPLDAVRGGPWKGIDSVDPDRSYLIGFLWMESEGGTVLEVHVNFRGYPGQTEIPTCIKTHTVDDVTTRTDVPCFSDAHGTRRMNGIEATVYTVNQDADEWHVLYAWEYDGSLYTLSEHVAPPNTYEQVVANLDRMLGGLALVEPEPSA